MPEEFAFEELERIQESYLSASGASSHSVLEEASKDNGKKCGQESGRNVFPTLGRLSHTPWTGLLTAVKRSALLVLFDLLWQSTEGSFSSLPPLLPNCPRQTQWLGWQSSWQGY